MAGKDQEFKYEEYLPELNPPALTEVTVTMGAAPGEVTMAVGPMKLDVVVDTYGAPQRTSVAMGPVTLIDERAHAEGAVE